VPGGGERTAEQEQGQEQGQGQARLVSGGASWQPPDAARADVAGADVAATDAARA